MNQHIREQSARKCHVLIYNRAYLLLRYTWGTILFKFGNRLKELRKKNGLTQQQLADALDITKSTVSYYERGERAPSPEILIKLANTFHISTDYLLGIEKTDYLNTEGLTDDDLAALRHMAYYLHLKNLKEPEK